MISVVFIWKTIPSGWIDVNGHPNAGSPTAAVVESVSVRPAADGRAPAKAVPLSVSRGVRHRPPVRLARSGGGAPPPLHHLVTMVASIDESRRYRQSAFRPGR